MKMRHRKAWSRLDNAAKIFPATGGRINTDVFRFSCELYEEIDPDMLQAAADKAVLEFPHFLCVMRKGFFWYYLEQCALRPMVRREIKSPCSKLYQGGDGGLLFDITYYGRRINLEMYHVLADGTGAIQFLKTIVCHYLNIRHAEVFAEAKPHLDYDASLSQKSADSFQKYYKKKKHAIRAEMKRAYQITGAKREDDRLLLIEEIVSARSLLEAAHRYHTTLTVYLTALLIDAIRQEMRVRDESDPVVLNIPVNLRSYFQSETSKNFFGMISAAYCFQERSGTFADIIETINETFQKELTREQLSIRMNSLASLEHNLLVKLAPLSFKVFCLKIARKVRNRGVTAVISNMGRIDMPEALVPYIRLFDVFAATPKLQLCVCSFQDNLSLGFSSAFAGTDIQRYLIRRLSEQGIEGEVRCNDFHKEGTEQALCSTV